MARFSRLTLLYAILQLIQLSLTVWLIGDMCHQVGHVVMLCNDPYPSSLPGSDPQEWSNLTNISLDLDQFASQLCEMDIQTFLDLTTGQLPDSATSSTVFKEVTVSVSTSNFLRYASLVVSLEILLNIISIVLILSMVNKRLMKQRVARVTHRKNARPEGDTDTTIEDV